MRDDTQADAAFEAFLAELPLDTARLDLASHMTETEIRHLGRARSAAA